jgi:hypothetical protein
MVADQEIERFLRCLLDREAESRYARTRRIPSTYTWKVVDYLLRLQVIERDELFAVLATRGSFALRRDRDVSQVPDWRQSPSFRRFTDTLGWMCDWKYMGLRMLKAIARDFRSDPTYGAFRDTPPEVIERAETIRPAKAPAIRKLVGTFLAERFGATAEKLDEGEWDYHGSVRGRIFTASIDYRNNTYQLRYDLAFADAETGVRAERFAYEGMLGIGFGWWDFITAENLHDSIVLLCDLIEESVTIPDKLRGRSQS